MLISCPKCDTTFSLPDANFRPGRKARCSQCGSVFVMTPKEDSAEPAPEEPRQTASQASEPAPVPPASAPAPSAPQPEPAPEKVSAPPLASEAPVKRKRKPLRSVLIAAAVLICLIGAGIGGWMILKGGSETAAPAPAGVAVDEGPAKVARITLVDTRQFIVKNDKLGDMVVIKGRAVNNFDAPKRFITVEARLLAKDGTELARQTRMCGPDPFLTQLQVLSPDALEEALSSRVEILLNNSNVQPGQDTPFWFVFPPPAPSPDAAPGEDGKPQDPWKDLWEFEVHPVDAQDVPPSEAVPSQDARQPNG